VTSRLWSAPPAVAVRLLRLIIMMKTMTMTAGWCEASDAGMLMCPDVKLVDTISQSSARYKPNCTYSFIASVVVCHVLAPVAAAFCIVRTTPRRRINLLKSSRLLEGLASSLEVFDRELNRCPHAPIIIRLLSILSLGLCREGRACVRTGTYTRWIISGHPVISGHSSGNYCPNLMILSTLWTGKNLHSST